MTQKRTRDLTQGNVFHNIVYFSLPFVISYFLQTLYGLADMYIVGQYNGANHITAVSVGSQVMHMITVMIVGIAMGSTVMISRAIGAKKPQEAARAIGNTVTVFLVISIVLCVGLLVFVNPIIHIMMVPETSVEQTRYYLMICFIGIPFITAYNVISSVFRGLGDSKSPMYFIAAACLVNIVLDYIFIGVMDLHAMGAALGTVVAQAVSVVFAFLYMKKRSMQFNIRKEELRPDWKMIGSIIRIGFPIAVQDGFIQVAFMIITVIANRRGVDIAAAVGIVEKIISMLFLIPSSMLSAVSAIAAQNVGAGQHGRARQTLWYGIGITVLIGLVWSILTQFITPQMIGLFTDDAEVIRYGAQYLKSYVFDCMIAGIHFCFSGYFCAYGKSWASFVHNVASILLVRIPVAYLASVWYPNTLFPKGIAAPLGSALSAVICVVIFRYMERNS